MKSDLRQICWEYFTDCYDSTHPARLLDEALRRFYGQNGRELLDLAIKTASQISAAPEQFAAAIAPQMPTPQAYPAAGEVFAAIALSPAPRVLILGQDPYHDGCACGLAFASRGKIAPSLRTIARELALEAAYGEAVCALERPAEAANSSAIKEAANAHQLGICELLRWAQQGVWLQNAALSVVPAQPGSHAALWRDFSQHLLARAKPDVAMLWGAHAQKFAPLLAPECLRLLAAHPSPLARGKFYGCGHFLYANLHIKSIGQTPINWLN